MIIEFTEKEIQNKIKQIAEIINEKQHNQPPIFICVLNGAFMFFTDLVKNIGPCEIDFIRAKSYDGFEQSEIQIIKSCEISLIDRDVYLVDDIYDSGNTMKALIKHLSHEKAKSITPITLFKKWHSNNPDLIYGFELHDEQWLIGYGLDASDGTQRNLKYVKGTQRAD
jgi:hypoxanthine phosphoribosyltransferase